LNDIIRGDQVLEEIERVEVRRKITVGIGDHSRATAQNHVTGDQPVDSIRASEQQRTGIAGVAGRRKHLKGDRAQSELRSRIETIGTDAKLRIGGAYAPLARP